MQEDATGAGLVANIASAANVYANYTGETKCLDINQQATGNLGAQGWDFQVSVAASNEKYFKRFSSFIFLYVFF